MGDVNTLPSAFSVEVRGHLVHVRYEDDYGLCARTIVPPMLVAHPDDLIAIEIDPAVSIWRRTYVVVDAAGEEVCDTPVASSLQYHYTEHAKRQRRVENYDTLAADLAELAAQASTLRTRHVCVSELDAALEQARRVVARLYDHWRPTGYPEATACLRRVRNLIAEIEGAFIGVVVRELLNGSIYHRDTFFNNQIRTLQVQLWIRSGGHEIIELITDGSLAAFYADRLGAANAANLCDVDAVNLALDRNNFAPDWMFRDPGLALSPDKIVVVTPKASLSLPVAYSLRPDGEEQVPTGTIRMRLADYQAATQIPTLDHGIELMCELTVDGKVAVRGIYGGNLEIRIKKRAGAKRRASSAPAQDEKPFTRHGTGPLQNGEVPPWYVGAKIRWR